MLVLVFAVLTAARVGVWKDDYSILRDTVLKSPDSAVAHYNLGVAYDGRGMLKDAIVEYELAIGLNSRFAVAYYNAACVYARVGDRETALKALKWAVSTGFSDIALILTDPDLNNLRGEAVFAEILGGMRRGVIQH